MEGRGRECELLSNQDLGNFPGTQGAFIDIDQTMRREKTSPKVSRGSSWFIVPCEKEVVGDEVMVAGCFRQSSGDLPGGGRRAASVNGKGGTDCTYRYRSIEYQDFLPLFTILRNLIAVVKLRRPPPANVHSDSRPSLVSPARALAYGLCGGLSSTSLEISTSINLCCNY